MNSGRVAGVEVSTALDERQPRSDHHQVEVHQKAGSPEAQLFIYAVIVLVGDNIVQAGGNGIRSY
jgi:hypothetical protein